MYRTTSVMALGLFLGLAPIGALAQTDDSETQLQTTQPSDTQQSTETETLQTDDQQATDTETLQTDDQQATDTETLQTDDQQATDTDAMQTDDQQATDTETLQTDDQQATDTETLGTDDADVATDTETDMTTDEDADVAADDEMATDEEADVATTDGGETPDVIPEQDTSEMLGSTLMGASVNLADEEIGTVSDLIIAEDNTVRGVVVGVGGFLGIGEKRVALPIERLTLQTTEPGQVEISTDMTRQELEEKEAFKTAAQVRSEEEAAQAQQDAEMQQPAEPTMPEQ